MATEEGVVIRKISSTHARIKTQKSSACKSCSSRDSCQTGEGGKSMEVDVVNTLGAKEGDTVVIEFETSALIKASFLIHIFPIVCLIVGAFVGDRFASQLNLSPSIAQALTGFIFFIIAFVILRLIAKGLAQKSSYQPKVIKIKRAL